MEQLTKENFWNDLQAKYPEHMKVFCNWIDQYKERVEWRKLFNAGIELGFWGDNDDWEVTEVTDAPKYHDLPLAMQFGIFLQFISESDKYSGICLTVKHPTDFEKLPDIIHGWFALENYEIKDQEFRKKYEYKKRDIFLPDEEGAADPNDLPF